MRLSPFDTVKPGKGESANFADFTFKFADEDEDEDAEHEAQGYDTLASELRVSRSDSDEDKIDRSHFAL
jgi:hypothetical protein